ncbi:SGNH/GDSL hydrolase family protein [Streptomyces rectiviolaceus]|uniref:SGNH/GDSL hydrolase family protein n=1 Tax=Streptomyces rectiviolaceus TaxID=332591 RepID=UPI0036406F00
MREFVRGVAWWTEDGRVVRADPADRERLPADTWERAGLPAGVRLEFTARGVSALEITYTASPPSATDAYRDVPAVFTLLAGEDAVDTPASPGEHRTLVHLPCPDGDFTLHLPETLRPALHGVRPVDGTLTPTAPRPRWLVYGDSIAEGWSVSRPHLAWPALAGRVLGVETVNLGYAGAARGELASAEQLASLEADLLTVAFGTNCWSRTPHSAGLLYETTRSFLDLVRRGHPDVPLLVVSPWSARTPRRHRTRSAPRSRTYGAPWNGQPWKREPPCCPAASCWTPDIWWTAYIRATRATDYWRRRWLQHCRGSAPKGAGNCATSHGQPADERRSSPRSD